jgi:hypothetical protein
MMLWKLVATFAFLALVLPHEPNIGMGRPSAFPPGVLERVRTEMFYALDKVRADLKANGD